MDHLEGEQQQQQQQQQQQERKSGLQAVQCRECSAVHRVQTTFFYINKIDLVEFYNQCSPPCKQRSTEYGEVQCSAESADQCRTMGARGKRWCKRACAMNGCLSTLCWWSLECASSLKANHSQEQPTTNGCNHRVQERPTHSTATPIPVPILV